MNLLRPAAALLLALFLASCAPHRPPLPVKLPAGMETVLLQRLHQFSGAFSSLRGVAKVRVAREGEAVNATQILLAQRPDRLRIEAISPFGNPVLVAAADGRELNVLLPGEGRFLSGPASYRNLARFTRLPVRLSDLVNLLLYDVPVIPYQEAAAVAGENGHYRLVLAGEEQVRQEVEFDEALRLVEAIYYQGEEPVLRVGYGKFAGSPEFPRSMHIETPEQQSEATLLFSEVAVNVPIPAERFTLSLPPGYSAEPLP